MSIVYKKALWKRDGTCPMLLVRPPSRLPRRVSCMTAVPSSNTAPRGFFFQPPRVLRVLN